MRPFGKKARMLKRARQSKDKILRQAELKTELGLQEDEDKIIVEKSNMIKFFINQTRALISFVCYIVMRGLAVIGLAAVIYPAPRAEIRILLQQIIDELTSYF